MLTTTLPGNSSARARDRLEAMLTRIADPHGEGQRTFLSLYTDSARSAADAADRRAGEGRRLGPLDGAMVSLKDLFDVAGEATRAGSRLLADAVPAASDATAVARLRAAGAVIVGKTNMTEFAFSGVGTNPHYGTPGNPADRSRIPGGSTSGGAVAVADGMCDIAIGTDTGGSARIPAALCGIVGFKPTASSVPRQGVFPLSPTLDSIGTLATSVEACALAHFVMAGERPLRPEPVPLSGLRLGIPQGLPLRDLDEEVRNSFAAAVELLRGAGAHVFEPHIPLFDGMAEVNSPTPLVVAEAFRVHRERLAASSELFDPIVRSRLESARSVTNEQYEQRLDQRGKLVRAMDEWMTGVDALVLPTTPIVAPAISAVSSLEEFTAANRLLLRNTAIANFFDLCAIALPIRSSGGLPTSLMLLARNGHDRALLGIAAAVEKLLATLGGDPATKASEPIAEGRRPPAIIR